MSLQINCVEFQSVNKIEAAELNTGNHKRKISCKPVNGIHSEQLNPPLECESQATLSLSITTTARKWLKRRKVTTNVSFDPNMVRSQAVENKFSHKVHEDLIMVLEISCSSPTPLPTAPLVPTTEESLNECPRFRILVIGRTGVGKTSLINYAFGINTAVEWLKVRLYRPLTGPFSVLQMIVQESNGFEPGEGDNLAAVESFIKKYRNQTAVGSQLHAIWLCFQIPLEQYGERMIEAGAEKFLREKKDILGNIPTIFVFTKYDTLTEVIEKEWVDAQKNYEDEAVDMEANQRLKDKCIPCILNLTGEADIPYIAVSTRKRFKARLEHLIQLTQKEIQARSPQPSEQAGVDSAPALALAIAQRVAPGLKIKGSIEVGKRSPSARLTAGVITDVFSTEGYWKAVFSGADFPGRTIKDCLRVIHDDVVQVWNFRDTSKILLNDGFRDAITNVVSGPQAPLSQETTSEDVTAVFLLPLVAVGKVIGWVLDTYTRIPEVQRKFMAYIVHLTHVLDILFTLTATRSERELTDATVSAAVKVYHASGKWHNVYNSIGKFTPSLLGGEDVISEIESLLWERYIADIELERAVEKTASELQKR